MSAGRSLEALPKAHVHLHLDGAMRRSTLLELADQAGVAATLPRGYGSFAAFTDTITAAAACLRTSADARRLVHEIAQDAALAGAVWVEPSMWPGLFGGRLGSDADVLDVVLDAGRSAQGRYGVGFGLVVAANRNRPPHEAVALARLAVDRRDDGVIGFGLDGDETAAPGPLFAEAFVIAREGGLLAVPHAGELSGPQSVRDALEVLGADRIMHGVTAVADPALLDRLAAGGVALDVCPTSNMMLSVVPLSPGTPSRRCSPGACPAASTPTTRCCSTRICSASTRAHGITSASPTHTWPAAREPHCATAVHPATWSNRP